jgi:(S)-2-hydroxy-acid oxidase
MKNNLFVTIREAKKKFQQKINKKKYDWVEAAAEDGYTNQKNFEDLKLLKIIPFLLQKPKKIELKKNILNFNINSALICCPMGHQTQFDKNGEIETAKGVDIAGSLAFFGTQSRLSLKDIRKENKKAKIGWLIFPFGNRKWIDEQIYNAEKYKCIALAVCLDANIRSKRYQDLEARYDARKFGRRTNPEPPNPRASDYYDWSLIKYIKNKTKLPLIIKGILSEQDAKKCLKIGIKYLWISNHGGRMFNSGISVASAVKKISKIKKKNNFTIIADGGVRKGTDIIKYLCLGADFVGIGRPIIYGLHLSKAKGVKKIFDILNEEFYTAMINGGFNNYQSFKINRIENVEKI